MNSDFAKMPIKLGKLGIWQALFERAKDRDPALGMVFLDGTNIRAHHKAAGQAHELPSAITLLEALPRSPRYVVCDRGYASNRFREELWGRGSRPVIPPKRNEPSVAYPKWAYRHRHLVENLWAPLKEWRAVATRYEKTAASFISVICIAATENYLKT